jgi:hypothetical protein
VYDPDPRRGGEPSLQLSYELRVAFDRNGPDAAFGERLGDRAVSGAEIEDYVVRVDIGLSNQPGSQGAGKEVCSSC